VSVTHDGTDAVIVEVSSIVNTVDGPDALWITADGGASWFVPSGGSIPDEMHVRFTFDVDVSACNAWHVQDASL